MSHDDDEIALLALTLEPDTIEAYALVIEYQGEDPVDGHQWVDQLHNVMRPDEPVMAMDYRRIADLLDNLSTCYSDWADQLDEDSADA